MKYYLVLLAGLGLSAEAFSQSTLYQTSPQQALDYHLELFDKSQLNFTVPWLLCNWKVLMAPG
jgi:hypothetical protein